ncbi:MAG: hypothetical protein HC883_02015 [Bdellovibrionaceae bacterium]|nr:hypothetical protein [Pseudobdellovibrionaceae bacterium]
MNNSSVSKFDLPEGNHLYTAMSEVIFGDEVYFGHGHSTNAIIATSKAFGESLERLLAFKYMRDHAAFAPLVYQATYGQGALSIEPTSVNLEFPPKELESSNGWALHFSASKAIESAVNEVLERTILQSTYIAQGWSGFNHHTQISLQGRDLTVWLTKVTFFGMIGGIIKCKPRNLPGRTYGYFVHRENSQFVLEDYLHAAFEALEPALFFDSRPDYRPNPSDSIATAQFKFATQDERENLLKETKQLQVPSKFHCHVLVFDIKSALDLEMPLYLAWCIGGDIVPLVLKSKMNSDCLSYFNQRLQNFGLSYDGSYEIPIL